MEVEIISTECIKPSSSSTPHLKTFKISLLDQFVAPIFYSISIFYPNTTGTCSTDQISERSLVLKHSLSKILSHYYPLAGKIKDSSSIDCNDEGVHYAEAKANVTMLEYLSQPDLALLHKLIPDVRPFRLNPIGAFVVMVQETTFACGGLAIGLSVSHMVLDGTAIASFIKAWASIAFSSSSSSSSEEEFTIPNFDAPLFFPPCDPYPKESLFSSLWSPFTKTGKVAARRLTFNASAISKLKAIATSSYNITNPTRVEVVSAIISKSVRAAADAKSIAIAHAVNIRQKVTPSFPQSSLGNFVLLASSILEHNETQLGELACKIRKDIREKDTEFVMKITPPKLFEDLKETLHKLSQAEEVVMMTSWCNFGLYNCTDFGWGKPIWIAHCTMIDSREITFYNVNMLNDTRSGNGVEAWLYLPQDVAAALDKNEELLQYASINLSPLSTLV